MVEFLKSLFPKLNNIYDFLKSVFLLAIMAILTKIVHPQAYNSFINSFKKIDFNFFIKLIDFSLLTVLSSGILIALFFLVNLIFFIFNLMFLKIREVHSEYRINYDLPYGSKLTCIPLYVFSGCKTIMNKLGIWTITLFSVLYFLSDQKGNIYIGYLEILL